MKIKKFLASVLCASLALSFAACGNTQTTTDATVTTDAATTTEATIATTEASTTAQTTTAATTQTPIDPNNPNFDPEHIVLSFGAISDVHINIGTTVGDEKLQSAISQLVAEAKKDDADGIDALAIAGDISDTGSNTEVLRFAKVIKNNFPNKNVMLTTGNHEYYGNKVNMRNYYDALGKDYFANDVDYDLSSGSRHCVVNGYHFIFVEPASYGNGCPYTEKTLKWLDTTLASITNENPNAYIFIFTHPMLQDTCYGSDLGPHWYTSYLTSTLEKYPQVMTFGGHLHFPINDERSIMQDKFTSLGCGSVRYLAIESGYANANGTVPDKAHDVSSGLLVQVDANGHCRITRMFFSQNTTFKEAWEVSAPKADGSHLTKYTEDRANGNKAPVLSGELKFTPAADPDIAAGNISIAAGTDDDFVHHYVIKVIDKASGTTVNTYNVLSDFYYTANPSDMGKDFSWSIAALPAGEYKVVVTAVDSWDAVSNELSVEFKIGGEASELPSELPDTYADIDFEGGQAVDTKGKLDITVNNAVIADKELTFAGKTATVPAFSVEASGQHAVVKFKEYSASTITELYNGEKGFSVEGVFINRAPSGSQGVICSTQNGGWGIAQSSGNTYLYTYIANTSSNMKAPKASSTTEMTHVVATFLYDSVTNKTSVALYLDGVLISKEAKAGKILISPHVPAANAFVLGADISTDGSGNDFKMTNFSLIDTKIYAEALNRNQVNTAYNNAVKNFG